MPNFWLTQTVDEEREKCLESLAFFCENYCHLYTGMVFGVKLFANYTLFKYQRRMLSWLEPFSFGMMHAMSSGSTPQWVVGKKFRGGGFTDHLVKTALWNVIGNARKDILYVTNPSSCSSLSYHLSRYACELSKYPEIFPEFSISQQIGNRFIFNNGSTIRIEEPKDALRNKVPDMIIMDDISDYHIQSDIRSLFASFYHTIYNRETPCFVFSSTYGGTWFHDIYNAAVQHRNGFKEFACDISEHPVFGDLKWQQTQKAAMSGDQWRLHYLQEFV